MPEIIITSDRQGNAKIETTGFTGQTCLKATEGLKELIGGEQLDPVEMTEESYRENSQELHGTSGG